VFLPTGYSVFAEGASDPRHPRSAAADRLQPGAADRARAEELPTLSERPRQVCLPGLPAGPQHAALLQRPHATHRGDGAHRLHADCWQSLPEIRIHLPPTQVCSYCRQVNVVNSGNYAFTRCVSLSLCVSVCAQRRLRDVIIVMTSLVMQRYIVQTIYQVDIGHIVSYQYREEKY